MRFLIIITLSILFLGHVNAQDHPILTTTIKIKGENPIRGNVIKEDSLKIEFESIKLGNIKINKSLVQQRTDFKQYDSVYIQLVDYSEYEGRLFNITNDTIHIEHPYFGVIKFPLRYVIELENLSIKKYSAGNPNATRYLFAPSAFPLTKGEGYYQNTYILVNSANYGVTNRLSLGGAVVLPLAAYINARYSIPLSEKWYSSFGIITGGVINGEAGFAIPFGNISYGNFESNLTLGVGQPFLFSSSQPGPSEFPLVAISGMKRIGKRLSLVTENWIIPYKERYYSEVDERFKLTQRTRAVGILSAGIRLFLNKNSSIDLAIINVEDQGNGILLPFFDYVYKF